MDPRFQPQRAMFYEVSLKEASRDSFSTNEACLAIRSAQIGLDFYEETAIDTGVVGLLNGIWLATQGFILATASLGASVAPPLAVAGVVAGVHLMALGIVDTLTYLSHIASGGSIFHSRKEMEEYENLFPPWNPTTMSEKATKWGLEQGGEFALKMRIVQLGRTPLFNKLPDRDDISLARDILDSLREPLACRGRPPEAHSYSVSDQGAHTLEGYGDRTIADEILKAFDDLKFSAEEMLNRQKPEPRANPPAPPPVKTPVPASEGPKIFRTENDPFTGEPTFTGDANPPDEHGLMTA